MIFKEQIIRIWSKCIIKKKDVSVGKSTSISPPKLFGYFLSGKNEEWKGTWKTYSLRDQGCCCPRQKMIGQAMELCDGGISGKSAKAHKLCPLMLSTVWRSCRYANGHSTQILLRPKYPSGLISVARCSKAVENRSTLAFIQAWHFRGLILAYVLLPKMLWIQNRAIERVLTSDL